jgi:hypothetical protein
MTGMFGKFFLVEYVHYVNASLDQFLGPIKLSLYDISKCNNGAIQDRRTGVTSVPLHMPDFLS